MNGFSGTKKLYYQAISQISQFLFKWNNIPIDISFSLTNKPGHYIYLEASNPRRRGDTALLLLKLEGSSFCIRFWYHMYGRDMGSLKIVHIIKQGPEKRCLIFKNTTECSQYLLLSSVNILLNLGPFLRRMTCTM